MAAFELKISSIFTLFLSEKALILAILITTITTPELLTSNGFILASAQLLIKNIKDHEEIQSEVYETGKEYNYTELKDWFSSLYQILLGQEQGPRIGTFIAIYGCAEMTELINKAIKGELVN